MNLASLLPKKLQDLDDPQTALPRIAKDRKLTALIESIIKEVPTHHDLRLGDARSLQAEGIHLVLTSPPYRTLKEYRKSEGQLGFVADYETFLGERVSGREEGQNSAVPRKQPRPTGRYDKRRGVAVVQAARRLVSRAGFRQRIERRSLAEERIKNPLAYPSRERTPYGASSASGQFHWYPTGRWSRKQGKSGLCRENLPHFRRWPAFSTAQMGKDPHSSALRIG